MATEHITGASASPRSGGRGKATCPKCGRTVVVITTEDGTLETDTEIIAVVGYPSGKSKQLVRRLHTELCLSYVLENERKERRERQLRTMGGIPPRSSTDAVVDKPSPKKRK